MTASLRSIRSTPSISYSARHCTNSVISASSSFTNGIIGYIVTRTSIPSRLSSLISSSRSFALSVSSPSSFESFASSRVASGISTTHFVFALIPFSTSTSLMMSFRFVERITPWSLFSITLRHSLVSESLSSSSLYGSPRLPIRIIPFERRFLSATERSSGASFFTPISIGSPPGTSVRRMLFSVLPRYTFRPFCGVSIFLLSIMYIFSSYYYLLIFSR